MTVPAVSVVIATRDYGRFLAEAISSVLAQTWTDFELVVVDDGSTDDTPAVVDAFLADARVRYHRTEGMGQSRAKNLGIQLSRSPLIAFLDGDDAWLSTKLERQIPFFANSKVAVVYSRRTLMDEAGETLPTPPGEMHRGDLYDVLLRTNPICFSSAIVRRSAIEAVGMFDPDLPLAIDYDWWLRLARHYRFDYVDESLVKYRTGHANLSSRLPERIAAIMTILRRQPRQSAEGWGSTYRTMGYVTRKTSPFRAMWWYWQAAWHDRRWLLTLKSILGGFVRPRR